jgi:hypothetical protein
LAKPTASFLEATIPKTAGPLPDIKIDRRPWDLSFSSTRNTLGYSLAVTGSRLLKNNPEFRKELHLPSLEVNILTPYLGAVKIENSSHFL